MPSCMQEFKFSVTYKNKNIKIFAHRIEQDETLCLRIRGIIPETIVDANFIVNQIHYHPSGLVNLKHDQILKLKKILPPLGHITEPILLAGISTSELEKFPQGSISLKKGDAHINLDDHSSVEKLSLSAWVTPKEMEFQSFFGDPVAKIEWVEMLYKVTYLIERVEKIQGTTNTQSFFLGTLPATRGNPHILADKSYANIFSVCRQIRNFMEFLSQSPKENLPENFPFKNTNNHSLRISLCNDGVIGIAAPCYISPEFAGMLEYRKFPLNTDAGLEIINNGDFEDITCIAGKTLVPIPVCSLYVKTKNLNSMDPAIIFIAKNLTQVGYYEMGAVPL